MNVLNYTEQYTVREIEILCTTLERLLGVLQSDNLTHSQKRAITRTIEMTVLAGLKVLIVDEKQKGDLPF